MSNRYDLPADKKTMQPFEDLLDLASYGAMYRRMAHTLKQYKTVPGEMWELPDGRQFIVINGTNCGRIDGVGLNNEHIGYWDNTGGKRITYKDIRINPIKKESE